MLSLIPMAYAQNLTIAQMQTQALGSYCSDLYMQVLADKQNNKTVSYSKQMLMNEDNRSFAKICVHNTNPNILQRP